MNEKNTPGIPGQEIDPSNTTPDSDLAKILAAIRGIGTRLSALEQRFEWLDRDCLKAINAASLPVPERLIEERPEPLPVPDRPEEEAPDTEPGPPHVPSIAFRSDGEVLLSLAFVQGANMDALADRERWEGIVLTEAERCDFLDAISDGADDAAAHVGGAIIKRSKKTKEPEGSASDE